MAKYMRIEPETDPATGLLQGANYLLPADADIEAIADQIGQALADGTSLLIPLDQLNGNPATSAYIVINGSRVSHVLIGEVPDDIPGLGQGQQRLGDLPEAGEAWTRIES